MLKALALTIFCTYFVLQARAAGTLKLEASALYVQIAESLLEAASQDNETAIHSIFSMPAFSLNETKQLLYLTSTWLNLTKSQNNPLHLAASKDSVAVTEVLLHELPYCAKLPNARGQYPIHIAAIYNSTSVLPLFLNYSAELIEQPELLTNATPIFEAASRGNLEAVKILASEGANLNAKAILFKKDTDARVTEAIHAAAANGHQDVVNYLLSINPNLTRSIDDSGNAPIVYATLFDYLEIVKVFLDNGSDLETTARILDDNMTIFALSCYLGHVDLVRFLYERGANFTSVSQRQRLQPIHLAVTGGRTEVVDFLLTKQPQLINITDESGFLPIQWHLLSFGANPPTGLLDIFLKHGMEINARLDRNETLLTNAVLIGLLPLVAKLVERGANLTMKTNGNMPIHTACSLGMVNIVEFFLKVDPSLINATGRFEATPLLSAVLSGRVEVVDLILRHGCDLERHFEQFSNATALDMAASGGELSIARLLVSKGANLTSRDSRGRVPLHSAASRNKVELIDLFLDNGVDIDIVDGKGQTAFLWTCLLDRVEAAKRLINRGANIDNRLADGLFPIHHAAFEGSIGVLKEILTLQPNMTVALDRFGNTPIVHATVGNHVEVVKYLLDKGADIETISPTNENRTIFAISCLLGHVDLVRLLYERGANFTYTSSSHHLPPIHSAANRGYTEIVDFLLTKEPQLINSTDVNGTLPLEWYFLGFPKYRQPALLDVFLKHGTDVNSRLAENVTCNGANKDRKTKPLTTL